jgi:Asp-tRNA(Asn)/Glu-tRNA(Gln) amidotransferase A subunit family amidase
LKPTRGRVTLAPFAGESWAGMSMGHAVTRTVRDSAAILDVVSGHHPGDPYTAPTPERPFLDEVGADPGRVRVAMLDGPPMVDLALDRECALALESAARLFDTLGHHVEPATWPELPTLPAFVLGVVSSTDIASKVALRLAELGRELRDDDLDLWVRETVERGRAVTGVQYVQAVATMHAIGRTIAAFMADYDVLLTPTMAIVPPKLGVLDPNQPFFDALPTLSGMSGMTSIANLTGQPAMSVPLHRTGDGLPVGIQCIGRFGDEATLFRLASQLEAAAPWPQYAHA